MTKIFDRDNGLSIRVSVALTSLEKLAETTMPSRELLARAKGNYSAL